MTTTSTAATESSEDVESFRTRARLWLKENMPPAPGPRYAEEQLDGDGVRARTLQRTLFDGGFAGICFPKEYGGQGLSPAHQRAFSEESAPYEMPIVFNTPALTICAPTILDFGTEEQKRRHLPAILRGEEIWVQFLSEPTGGSDLAGLVTRADKDGDVWILSGSKIWSTGAYRADYALCLARTDWQATKHRGLTMFIVKIHQPSIELQQIEMVNGSKEFCQEFFDDVTLPEEDVVGQVNDGWTVASRLLFHERDAVGGGSPYASGIGPGTRSGPQNDVVELARAAGTAKDVHVRQLVAEARVGEIVQQQLIGRVTTGLRTGHFTGPAGSIPRLYAAVNNERRVDIELEIAGSAAGVWAGDDLGGRYGIVYLQRQGGSLGGGSNEMQRNIISERVLGMPREYAADRDKPFEEVRRNQAATRS
ncbi:MAG: acyl-CoA dehydrogenase family protein [Acidimicrobiales bacterium]